MKKIIIVVAVFCSFVISQAQAAEQCPVHRLTVTEIKTITPDSGLSIMGSVVLRILAEASGAGTIASGVGYAAYASDHFVFDTNILQPDAGAGWDGFTSLIDRSTSGQDDLIVQVNGTRIIPGTAQVFHEGTWATVQLQLDPDYGASTGVYQPMFSDSRLIPDTSISFFKYGTLRLIEHDNAGVFASDSDDMGSIIFSAADNGLVSEGTLSVTRDCFKPGAREAIIDAGLEDDIRCVGQAIYEVSYKVEPNEGTLEDVPERLICGSDMCADISDLSSFDFRDGSESDLLACEPGYEPWDGLSGESTIITATNDFFTVYGNFRICELTPSKLTAPTSCGADFAPLANVSSLNEGDIIVLKGETITSDASGNYLASSEGQYLARCHGCVPGVPSGSSDNAVVHVIDPNRTTAQWTVKKLANNKIALQSETGKYLARCQNCIPGVTGDSAFVHVSDSGNPFAQFTIEPAAEANEFTLKSDNDKYLSSCPSCVPDQLVPGYKFNASLHLTDTSGTSTGWEISVRQKDRIDPVIYSANRTFDSDITIKSSEIWVVNPGEIVTINSGAALIIENGGSIENNGTIINNGSIKLGDLGQLINQGTIINKEIIRLSGGVIDNLSSGVIDNSQANHIQNYAGAINNTGAIYDPFDRYYGVNPTPNLPETGFYLGADSTGQVSCIFFGGPGSQWDPTLNTCSIGNAWLRSNQTLTIANGVTLILSGTLTNDGTINNNDTINNTNGLLRQCGTFNGNIPSSTQTGNWDVQCIQSAESLQCSDFNGQWNPSTNTCENVLGKKDAFDVPIPIANGEVLTIRDGVTWQIIDTIENDGEIHVEKNGAIVLQAGTITNRAAATIINDGLISISADSFGTDGQIENNGQISNYGTINNASGTGYIYGAGGFIDNWCGSVYAVDRTPPVAFGDENTITDNACPPPDTDGDDVADELDAFPYDINEDTDTDGDGVGDVADAFPLNGSESSDTGDGDCGVIITQTAESGNGCGDNSDQFPLNPLETIDVDEDCGEIITQTTDSGNGCGDNSDAFPLNDRETNDSDSDCGVIITQTVDSGNSCGDNADAFPLEPSETRDSDNDGVGDNADVFPNDADNARLIAVDNSNGWSLATGLFSTSAMQEPIPEGLPTGVDLPLGIVALELNSGTIGSESVITITYPTALDPAMVWWKYGPTTSDNTPHWYVFDGAVISGNTVTLTIKDGGTGDDDLLENGSITDPGGPGLPAAPVITETPVNEQPASGSSGGAVNLWFLLLLSSLYLRRFNSGRYYSS